MFLGHDRKIKKHPKKIERTREIGRRSPLYMRNTGTEWAQFF